MAKKLDPIIADVLKRYGFGHDAAWDCHGTWVVYHRVLEQIAAKAEITYDTPTVLVAERDCAAILVTGSLNGKREWSIGEAAIGQNYKVSGKQAAYPFAMAEKRAKDRVILKLIGLHGLAYSEEEADEFRAPNTAPATDDPAITYTAEALATIRAFDGSAEALHAWWMNQGPARREHNLSQGQVDILREAMKQRLADLKQEKAA